MVDLIFFVCSLSSLYYPAVCSHRDLILYAITVGKITAVQEPCYIYRRQNYKHNSNFITKTFANLIEPKMWPLCMARNGGPSVDVRIHSWPRTFPPPPLLALILGWFFLAGFSILEGLFFNFLYRHKWVYVVEPWSTLVRDDGLDEKSDIGVLVWAIVSLWAGN